MGSSFLWIEQLIQRSNQNVQTQTQTQEKSMGGKILLVAFMFLMVVDKLAYGRNWLVVSDEEVEKRKFVANKCVKHKDCGEKARCVGTTLIGQNIYCCPSTEWVMDCGFGGWGTCYCYFKNQNGKKVYGSKPK